MRRFRVCRNDRGFTLVELIVVVAILGLVVVSMLGLLTDTQQSAYTQEEVAVTQQNLRLAMDFISKDIQMAGFLIPETNQPLETTPANLAGGAVLTLRAATTSQAVARLSASTTVANAPATFYTFTLASADMVSLFSAGDNVRLITTPDQSQRINALFEVGTAPTATTLNIKGFNAATTYTVADLLIMTDVGHPAQINYDLNNNELRRSLDGGTTFQTIAENISNVDFEYLTDSGEIVAVRITLTGTAFDLKTKSDKNRQLVKLISLKNV